MKWLVVDSSVLASLSGIGVLSLLPEMFFPIFLPEAVRLEVVDDGEGWLIAKEAQEQILDGSWLVTRECGFKEKVRFFRNRLDPGESEVIALAKETKCVAAIDERKGRKVAEQEGVRVTGSVAILLLAKSRGLLKQIKPLVFQLVANGFRASPALIEKILHDARE